MNYIIGTGNFGIIVKTFLEFNNLEVSGFIELNPNSLLSTHDNLPIVSIENIDVLDNLFGSFAVTELLFKLTLFFETFIFVSLTVYSNSVSLNSSKYSVNSLIIFLSIFIFLRAFA